MDTGPQGAGVAGAVTSFPVAVVLTAENFDFAQTKPQGEDVRFGGADGTPLPYELEHFDAQAQEATFWVLVPEIQGNNQTQSINLYWGNAAAGLADDSHAVFTAGAGFLGVWHLGEDGGSDAGAFHDATAAQNHGTGVNLMAGSSAPGVLGRGNKLLNSMRQWISVEDPEQRYRPDELTASIWGVADGFPATWGSSGSPGYQCIYSSGEAWTIQRETGSRFESCLNHNCAIGDPMEVGQWYHFVVRRSGGSHQFFMNGVQVASGGVATRNDAKPLGIGQMSQYLDPVQHVNEQRSWEGTLDEVRVLSAAVSDDWIKLDYESQRPGSTFLKFGAAVAR
jgi:biopolymer transport protein ExbB